MGSRKKGGSMNHSGKTMPFYLPQPLSNVHFHSTKPTTSRHIYIIFCLLVFLTFLCSAQSAFFFLNMMNSKDPGPLSSKYSSIKIVFLSFTRWSDAIQNLFTGVSSIFRVSKFLDFSLSLSIFEFCWCSPLIVNGTLERLFFQCEFVPLRMRLPLHLSCRRLCCFARICPTADQK